MKTPDFPHDEHERIEDLRSLNILDTPSEERFDRLTRMAKRMFKVPIALVSLVDENRQWFKSCVGLEVSETARDISFCGHAILGDDVFIIPETYEDERFMDNPLVLNAPHIRFYAGCPLTLPNSRKIGTLCIIDVEPRHLEEEDLDLLRDLASMVESEINAVQIATIDELTNINNRRGFNELAQKSLDYCKRNKVEVSLVYFDLNDFKPINDNFGHIEGDRALTTFASLMKNNIRESDILARLGGDEFAALLLNASPEGASFVIEKFQQSLDEYNEKSGIEYELTFSHGIVKFDPDRHRNVDQLLADGDVQMYNHKKQLKAGRKKSVNSH